MFPAKDGTVDLAEYNFLKDALDVFEKHDYDLQFEIDDAPFSARDYVERRIAIYEAPRHNIFPLRPVKKS